jgi:hypothetical protein
MISSESTIIVELEILIAMVKKFLAKELCERVKGCKDVNRRAEKFWKTHNLLMEGLNGVDRVNWIRDRVTFQFSMAVSRADVVFGDSFQYLHDPVILARRIPQVY